MPKRGLIVGKFLPLHRGHQLLIETGLAHVDDLTVVVYDDGEGGNLMPAHKRAGWISSLYPQVENIFVSPNPGLPTGMDKDSAQASIHYASQLDFLDKFDLVFSSEHYGESFARQLGAQNVVVDQARELVPISGTRIREDMYENRGYIDPLVYRSLIQKVVFVGTESAGKSTLAKAMAEKMDTLWVHEYGRELWEEQSLQGSFADLLKVGQVQHRREEAAALHSRRYLFCDTNAWTTLQWSKMYHDVADQRLIDLADSTMNEYLWIFCHNDFGYVQDGSRELGIEGARRFSKQLQDDLQGRIPILFVGGSLDERIRQVSKYLEEMEES